MVRLQPVGGRLALEFAWMQARKTEDMSGYNRCDADGYPVGTLPARTIQDTPENCWYCGRELKGGEKTRDHIVAKSMSRSKSGFTVNCCFKCNHDKGSLSLDEWRLVLAYRNKRIPSWNGFFYFFGELASLGVKPAKVMRHSTWKPVPVERKKLGLWRRLVTHIPWLHPTENLGDRGQQ